MELREGPAEQEPDGAGELCSRCGHLRAPEHLVKRVLAKGAQLARFGLLDRPLREDR
jgi:hypothetical protein